jgi:prolipoprotein diacylglyceryl transferase
MIQFAYIYWDPKPEIFVIPLLNWPILWYGALFALGFALGFPIFTSILVRYFLQRLKLEKLYADSITPVHKLATHLADRLTVYVVVSTVLGARIGHFLFYEKPSDYLNNFGEIFEIWNGGLASHGAAIGIVLAVGLFAHRYRAESRGLSWVRLLDFIAVPTALAGGLIRVGNFVNQEILGKKTDVPWAVIFGHPADHTLPVPRHPVQLYEAFLYFAVFFLLWHLSFRPKYLLEKGKLIGLFLILVFGFRFFVEYLKLEQSHLLPRSFDLTMGQLLSLPAVLAGFLLLFWKKKRA